MKLLFKGGKVVSGEGTKKRDILVKGEKILAVGENLDFKDADVIDVRGKLLFPGVLCYTGIRRKPTQCRREKQ